MKKIILVEANLSEIRYNPRNAKCTSHLSNLSLFHLLDISNSLRKRIQIEEYKFPKLKPFINLSKLDKCILMHETVNYLN